MYRLFYNYEVSGDVLFILIDPEKKTEKTVKNGNVAALYAGTELIGINVFHLSDTLKLKSKGMIPAPEDKLVDVINVLLKNAALSPLPYCRDSGYHVAEITALEEHPLDEKAHIVTLSLGPKKLTTVSWYPNLALGKDVVVMLEGTIAYDGSVFHAFVSRNIPNECSILSASELHLGDNKEPGAFLVEGYQSGADFYLGGEGK